MYVIKLKIMTNIMVKKRSRVGEIGNCVDGQYLFDGFNMLPTIFHPPCGVGMTDGLGSNGIEEAEGYQKLFRIGDNFLLATASRYDYITAVIEEALELDQMSPEKLGKAVMKITNTTLKFKNDDEAHFILTGINNGTVEIYLSLIHI